MVKSIGIEMYMTVMSIDANFLELALSKEHILFLTSKILFAVHGNLCPKEPNT